MADMAVMDSYGASLRKQVKKMEISQHAKYSEQWLHPVR
jgi:hypothetical protein